MSYAEWAAICGGITVAIALGTILWRLATALGEAKASARAARAIADESKAAASSAVQKADAAHDDLARFREYVAKEYASRGMLDVIMAGIDNLGKRIDRLFEARP